MFHQSSAYLVLSDAILCVTGAVDQSNDMLLMSFIRIRETDQRVMSAELVCKWCHSQLVSSAERIKNITWIDITSIPLPYNLL
jgi:hypothetical protein